MPCYLSGGIKASPRCRELFAQLPTPVQCPAGCPVRGAAGENQDSGFGMSSSASSLPEPYDTEPFRSSITESPPA